MKCTQTFAALTAFLLSAGNLYAADLVVPVTVSLGSARTSVVVGTATGATDGYDKGLDVPPADVGETLTAVIPHPGWNVTSPDGKPVTSLYRDIRGSLPQQYSIQITSTSAPMTLSWDKSQLPTSVNATLVMPDGSSTDMKQQASATLQLTTAKVVIILDEGDTTPPSIPQGLKADTKETSFFLTWIPNTETDLKGYKLHWSKEGGFNRTADLKNVTNYNLMNVASDVPYYISVSAYDANGNESPQSPVLTAMKSSPAPIPAPEPIPAPIPITTPPVTVAPTGDFNGDGKISPTDVAQLLRFVYDKRRIPTKDQLARGDMDSDGKLTMNDAELIDKLVSPIYRKKR